MVTGCENPIAVNKYYYYYILALIWIEKSKNNPERYYSNGKFVLV
jgi:hypothetical protein